MNNIDWNPAAVLGLAAPFMVLIGVLAKVGADWLAQKWANKSKSKELIVSEKLANVSEQEAQTHQIQAIFEGFNTSLNVVSKRAEDAENAVKELRTRVEKLEDERDLLISHIVDLEQLVPSPPGPPARPKW